MDKRKKLSPVFHKAVYNSGSAPHILPLGINRQIHSYSIFALILCSPAGKAGRIRKRQGKSARQERRCRALFIGCFQSKTGFEEIHRQGSLRDGGRWGPCPHTPPTCSNSRSSRVACPPTAGCHPDWALVRRHASTGKRIPAGRRRRVARSCAVVDGVASSRHWPVLRLCTKLCGMAAEQSDRLRSPHPLLRAFLTAYSSALCLLRQPSEQNRESARLAMKARWQCSHIFSGFFMSVRLREKKNRMVSSSE